jgi:hypothetical protein
MRDCEKLQQRLHFIAFWRRSERMGLVGHFRTRLISVSATALEVILNQRIEVLPDNLVSSDSNDT